MKKIKINVDFDVIEDQKAYENMKNLLLSRAQELRQKFIDQKSLAEMYEIYQSDKNLYGYFIGNLLFSINMFDPDLDQKRLFELFGQRVLSSDQFMISFNGIEKIFDEINSRGIVFSRWLVLLWIVCKLESNYVLMSFERNYNGNRVKYNKIKNASEPYIGLINYRRNNSSKNKKQKIGKNIIELSSDPVSMMKDLKNINYIPENDIDLENTMKAIFRGKHPYGILTKNVFDEIVKLNKPLGISELDIKKGFMPLFYIIYDDNREGLMRESTFLEQDEIFKGSFINSYPKYYNLKLKTHIGF